MSPRPKHQFTKIDRYAPRPRPNPEARNARAYTPIAEPYAQLFERLRVAGVLQPVEGKTSDPILVILMGASVCLPLGSPRTRIRVIKCTPVPPNVNNNPLPNYENREVNMVTLDDEYGTPDYPNIDEADAMTSSAQPVITVQLREPLIVQTYLPRVVVTTLVAKKPEYDTKAVPWDYRAIRWHSCRSNKHVRGTNKLGYEPALGRDRHRSNDTIFVPNNPLFRDRRH
ncbi:hypothetical protein H5410_014157 [Solanum commersonii]|uniref:Uncharacterized protein n=1 Tax=Solanum commersonii TaxID=4109 RepID=A0A9J5ZQ48_SOLCO|nr:hypothetical protein H5410_014157 [Solanum commersonii]